MQSWEALDWSTNMTTEDLLLNRMRQLEGKDSLVEQAATLSQASREENKEYYDKHMRHRPANGALNTDDMVLVYDSANDKSWSTTIKLNNRWLGPYKIFKIEDNGSFRLKELDGTKLYGTVSGDRLKKFLSRPIRDPENSLITEITEPLQDDLEQNNDDIDDPLQGIPEKTYPFFTVLDDYYQVAVRAFQTELVTSDTSDSEMSEDGIISNLRMEHSTELSTFPETYGSLHRWLGASQQYAEQIPMYERLVRPLYYTVSLGQIEAEIPWTQRLTRIFRTLQRLVLVSWSKTQQSQGDLAVMMAAAELCVAQDQQRLFTADAVLRLQSPPQLPAYPGRPSGMDTQ